MKTIFALLILMAFFTSCNVSESKTINVIGQAKMKVVPDMVELSLQAYSVKPAMKDAVAETQAAVKEILTVCKKYVVNSTDIKVSTISTNKAYDYSGSREKFIGYDAMQVLDVTLKDISRIEQFTEELLATRISKIQSVRYNHTKADSILREVNLLALEDARKTAEKMCDKMNVKPGNIVYLSNFENKPNSMDRGMHYSGTNYEMNLYNKSFGGKSFKMTAEILEFSDVAYAGFEINE